MHAPEPAESPPPGPATAPLTALGVTLLAQMLVSLALIAPSVLAPAVSADLGVPAQYVGWLVSLAYLAAMLSGLGGGAMSPRYGPVRLTQWAVLSCGLGLALLAAGWTPALLMAALVIGAGYGVTNPTATEILSRHAPVHRRGLFFSIKQAGVPLGVAIAGALFPWLIGVYGWRGALLIVALPMAVLALGVGAARGALQLSLKRADAGTGRRPALRDMLRSTLLTPLREVFAFAPTRRLALISLVYALTQVSFLTFLISLLTIEHGFSLALSAGLLAGSQAVSVIGRIGWGHASDRWIDPTVLLGSLGLLMAVGIGALGLAPVSTPWPWMLALTLLCAATAVAWNGVFFADLVRQVPPHNVAQATGATQFMTFLGGMTGSGLFAAFVSVTGSYSTVFSGLALLPALAGSVILFGANRARRERRLGKARD